MSRFDQNHVVIKGCTVVWDGITRPDQNQDGTPKYNVKVVIEPNNPALAEFYALSQETLQASKFAGVLPAGGRMPIGTAGPTEFNGLFPGFAVISAKTKFAPKVHAEDVSILEPMQYAQMLYPGQKVDLLVHCYAYDAKGNQGVAAGLDGLQIHSSLNAPRLEIGTGGIDTSGAFGAAPAPVAGQIAGGIAPTPGQVPQVQPAAPALPQVQPAYPPQPPAAPPAQPAYPPAQPAYPAQGQGFMPPVPGQ